MARTMQSSAGHALVQSQLHDVEAELASMTSNMTRLQDELVQQRKQASALSRANRALQAELSGLQHARTQLQADAEEAIHQQQSWVNRLERTIQQLRDEHCRLNGAATYKQTELDELRVSVDVGRMEARRMEESSERQQQAEHQQLSHQRQQLQEEVRRLNEQSQQLAADKQQLHNEYATMREEALTKDAEVASLRASQCKEGSVAPSCRKECDC